MFASAGVFDVDLLYWRADTVGMSSGFGSAFLMPAAEDLTHWDEQDWLDFFEERAAIYEYDSGHTRRAAEELARAEVWALRGRKER
jgi:hypothetical protein